MLTSSIESESGVIELAPMLDLTAAEPLHRMILGHAWDGDQILVSGAAVERISTAAVQVLLAAAAEAKSRGMAFTISEPSPALKDSLIDLGVSQYLGIVG